MLPPKCELSLQCQEETLSPRIDELMEPINYGLQQAPLVMDTCSPRDPTRVGSLECEDNWRKAKEDWFTTRFSYGLPNPFVVPSCPPNSPEPTWSPPDQLLQENMCGKRKPELATPLNGVAPSLPEGIAKPTGKQFVGVPKEEDLNLFHQTFTFDVIMHSEELAQIMYNLFAERLSAR